MRQPRTLRPLANAAKRAVLRLCRFPFTTRTLVLGMVTILVSGAAHAVAQPATDSSGQAAELVEGLSTGIVDPEDLPPGFTDEMGYAPSHFSGTLVHPRGGCSTPGGFGPDRFTRACQVHDLGYDVLRYAELDGARLGAKARLVLDWHLYDELLHSCESPTCSVTATVYYTAVSLNSVRQGFKAPHEEPVTPWTMLAFAVFGLSAVSRRWLGDGAAIGLDAETQSVASSNASLN